MESIYADMLEYRQQMYEGVPFAHIKYTLAYNQLISLPHEVIIAIIRGEW